MRPRPLKSVWHISPQGAVWVPMWPLCRLLPSHEIKCRTLWVLVVSLQGILCFSHLLGPGCAIW